jgi:hypothetical protein
LRNSSSFSITYLSFDCFKFTCIASGCVFAAPANFVFVKEFRQVLKDRIYRLGHGFSE